jgi:septal ring factor EnvC (AmiA/AmiB activator)
LEAESAAQETETVTENSQDTASVNAPGSNLTFSSQEGLVWPIVGKVLINYSMDKTVYFPTLDQYKYNPAIMIQATEGETITAAADGRVSSIYNDPQFGNCVQVELGDGYELTYGQLGNIELKEGDYMDVGDVIGTVASPTKYFSVEGTNVYFKLTLNGEPVDPLNTMS